MADIRKRIGKRGTTYQVRYAADDSGSRYRFKTFQTLKEARAFIESGSARVTSAGHNNQATTVYEAVDMWLRICEKEGLNGREPVTRYTYENYKYRADIIKEYPWPKVLQDLQAPDIVAFRSWLLSSNRSRSLASKVLSSLQSVLKEMTVRGIIPHNVASGIYISSDSRYQQPVTIPSTGDIVELLRSADRLANSRNAKVANAWERYRPMLYLAADSGMRPQEYLALARNSINDRGVYVARALDGSGSGISVTKTPASRRFIELSDQTIDMVKHYAENRAPTNKHDLVFPAANGRWQSRRNWQRRGFNVACHESGLVSIVNRDGHAIEIPKYRPYDLRHFFASKLIEQNVNLKKIQVLMGHTNIETTLNVYGHLLDGPPDERDGTRGMLEQMTPKSCGKYVAESTQSLGTTH